MVHSVSRGTITTTEAWHRTINHWRAAELFLIGTIGAPRIKNRSTRNLLLTGDTPTHPEDIRSIIVDTNQA